MVSFWPWKSDDTSPASFEKALSSLSEKVIKNSAQLDSLRQRSRRIKALWTLYTSFTYLLYSVILAFVLGWRQWGIFEYSAVISGPILIFGGRYAFTAYFDYRISVVSARLDEIQKEREATIEKLKTATKYNSTQQLLEKYGGSPPTSPQPSPSNRRKSGAPKPVQESPKAGQRTGFAPPPTANIQSRAGTVTEPGPPSSVPSRTALRPNDRNTPSMPVSNVLDDAEFAPNAFSQTPAPSHGSYQTDPRWYDRFLDLLMGEDETLAKYRIALICKQCKLVNGQAPPGTKSLDELGRWRCSSCGSWNGEESEANRIIAQAHDQERSSDSADRTDRSNTERGGVLATTIVKEEDTESDPQETPDSSRSSEDGKETDVVSKTPDTRSRRRRTRISNRTSDD